MKKLKIGLFPLSLDLSHPGDRRRVVSWARSRKHELVVGEQKNVDLIFMSEGSDFLTLSRIQGPPKIFDLIDGYLTPQDLCLDFLRGLSKVVTKQHCTYPRSYTSIVREACGQVDMVICSSPEQELTISPYSSNVRVILDNHSEFPLGKFTKKRTTPFSLFWEGTTHTLGGLEKLINTVHLERIPINIVTDPNHARVLGKFFKVDVKRRLDKSLGNHPFKFYPWAVRSVISIANESNLAVLPVDVSDQLQMLKPENRLLIMFRLGLPCLTSGLPSYVRIENELNVKITCSSVDDWLDSINIFRENLEFAEYQVSLGQRYILENHTEEILFRKWDQAIERLI